MSGKKARINKGVPAGGQFAEKKTPEPEVVLRPDQRQAIDDTRGMTGDSEADAWMSEANMQGLEERGIDIQAVRAAGVQDVASLPEAVEAHKSGLTDEEWGAYADLRAGPTRFGSLGKYGPPPVSHRDLCEARAAGIDLRAYKVVVRASITHDQIMSASIAGVPPGRYKAARRDLSHDEIVELGRQDVNPVEFARAVHAVEQANMRSNLSSDRPAQKGSRLKSRAGKDALRVVREGADVDEYWFSRDAGLSHLDSLDAANSERLKGAGF